MMCISMLYLSFSLDVCAYQYVSIIWIMVSCFTNLMKNQYLKRKCVAFTLYFRISVLQNTISFWVMGGFISFHFSSVFIYLFFFRFVYIHCECILGKNSW